MGSRDACGTFTDNDERGTDVIPDFGLYVVWELDGDFDLRRDRGSCSFAFPAILAGKAVARATLRPYQKEAFISPCRPIIVDQVDFGAEVGTDDMFSTPLQSNIGTLSTTAALGHKSLGVTDAVVDDLLNA